MDRLNQSVNRFCYILLIEYFLPANNPSQRFTVITLTGSVSPPGPCPSSIFVRVDLVLSKQPIEAIAFCLLDIEWSEKKNWARLFKTNDVVS